MPNSTASPPDSGRELVLRRNFDAPPATVFRAWSDPALLPQWWAPRPYATTRCTIDLRPGGVFETVMRAPDGSEFPSHGVFLEIVPNRKIVLTDAFTDAWTPSAKPFMTTIVTFEERDGGTDYTARVLHWTEADREAHEKMGFHEGWGLCADQLAALMRTL